MNHVMDIGQQAVVDDMLPVLRMEIDYELTTLYEAMQSCDSEKIQKSKERLEGLRQKWVKIKGI